VDPPEAPLLFEREEGNDGTVEGAMRTCAGSSSANTLQERENAGINSENRIEKQDVSGLRRIIKEGADCRTYESIDVPPGGQLSLTISLAIFTHSSAISWWPAAEG
jgi:hypothetical protein